MRNRQQIIQHLYFYRKAGTTPSEAGIRCAEFLERLVGLHHIEANALRRARWDTFFVQITLQGSFSTTDFHDLTRLVFLAHDLCIRVEIMAASRGKMTLMLHPREGREGAAQKRHPTIEAALENFRSRNPVRRCRSCGCTESDCRQCIAKTGAACWWVESDLCSACVPAGGAAG